MCEVVLADSDEDLLSGEENDSDDSLELYTDSDEESENTSDQNTSEQSTSGQNKSKDVLPNNENSDQSDGPSSSKQRRVINASRKYIPEENYGWNTIEEMQLLNAFKDYGTGYMKAICPRIQTKNTSEIKEYISRKRKVALATLRSGISEENEAPIDKWISYLCKLSPNDDYKSHYIARALKYIALFEDRDEENEKDIGVNLKDCFLILSSLLGGDGPKYADRITSYYLHSVIQDFAKYIKSLDTKTECKYLKSTSKPAVKCYGKKKTSSSTDAVLNPLQIPVDVLKID